MRILLSILLILFLAVYASPGLSAGPGSPLRAMEPPAEADTTSLIPTTIKQTELTITIDRRTVVVRVQYAVKENPAKDRSTIFVLPVWVIEHTERIVGGQKSPCSPSDRLLPADEKRPVQFNVVIRNLLDKPDTEKLIQDQLKQYVAQQFGLGETAFRFDKPFINDGGVRFTLVGRGRGEEPEIALSNTVPAADGVLGFDLDTAAVRRCEQLQALPSGLALANATILATGPMKVRFERLEFDAQVRYLRAAVADFRKRIGSAVNPSGPPPDVIIPMQSIGSAEARNEITSLLQQSLRLTVSTRSGAADLPLLPLLNKAVESLIRQGEVDQADDAKRITFLMENQVSITATLGEIKRLQQLDESGRTDALRHAIDHFTATQRGETSHYSGNLQVGWSLFGASASGSGTSAASAANATRDQQQRERFQQSFNRLVKSFEGNVKLPSGLHVDDRSLAVAEKDLKAEFTHNTFFFDYTLHRFAPIRLVGTTDFGANLGDWMQKYAQLKTDAEALHDRLHRSLQDYAHLKAEHDKTVVNLTEALRTLSDLKAQFNTLLQATGKPDQWTEAKTNMDRVAKLAAELEQKLAALDKDLTGSNATALAQLQKDLASIKKRARLTPLLFLGHTDIVRAVVFSPDGKWLATASADRTARIWDAQTGQELRLLRGHTRWVQAVAFSPDGRWLATASDERTARIWDAE